MFPSHVLEEVPQKGATLEQTYWNTKGNQHVPQWLLVSTCNHYLLVQEKEKTKKSLILPLMSLTEQYSSSL